MQIWITLFVISILLVVYNYAGYAVIAWVLTRVSGSRRSRGASLQSRGGSRWSRENTPAPTLQPGISFIVAAYNEQDIIEKKILNSLHQDYDTDKIEFIFVTDGSTDDTPRIVRNFPAIRLLHAPVRNGKSAAVNRAVQAATRDILIFSDANTLLNREAVARIAAHYADPRIGGVAGEKKVRTNVSQDENVGAGEGLYWKYESLLKQIDADFHSVVGAAGELFSLRTALYEPLSGDIILDDFILSLRVAEKGYPIAYEPNAYAMEEPSFSFRDEQKRKVRIAAGGFQSIIILRSLLAFWRQPRLSFLYISHRVLRWALSPFCLVLAFVSSGMACLLYGGYLPWTLFSLQLLFYGLALIAALLPGKQPALLRIPYYFTFMNVSVILGFFRFLRGKQSAVWEKARRIQSSTT